MKKTILLIFLLSSASTVLAQSGNRLNLYAAGGGAVRITDRIGLLVVSDNETVTGEANFEYWEAIFAFGAGFRYELLANWNLLFEAWFDVVADDYDPVQFSPIKIGREF